jgi:uncharacterized repeat protein (TIGR03803 family)
MRRKCSFLLQVTVIAVLCGITALASTESVLHSFHTNLHGQYPAGGLISDAAGNLYGMTTQGGFYGWGTVFELSPSSQSGWDETVLYDFQAKIGPSSVVFDGVAPVGALVFDSAGNLYGSTTGGGGNNGGAGTVFKLTHANGKWTAQVLWNFMQNSPKDGFNPQGGLVFDKAGNLYGTTRFGGASSQANCDGGCGTVFRLTPRPTGQWKETILYVFQDGSDGLFPNDALAIDASGNLYGTAETRHGEGAGLAFKLTPSASGAWTQTVLYAFNGGADGLNPGGGLILDSAGNLYGTTSGGGSGTACNAGPCGTVFQLAPAASGQWSEKVLYSFNGSDGRDPQGKLLLDRSGTLYGTTASGGTGGSGVDQGYEGVVFKLAPGSDGEWAETVLWNFTGHGAGREPQFGVTAGAQGQLYGATAISREIGDPNKNGTIFEVAPDGAGNWTETTLTNFPYADGGEPQASLIADSAGNLYGTTSMGGAHGYGTVFRLSPSEHGWQETILYNFPTGYDVGTYLYSNPSNLIFDDAGNLYGETEYGGGAGFGNVFELTPTAAGQWAAKDLFVFKGAKTGGQPLGGLLFDADGNLYGTTQFGGSSNCASGCGTVFKLTAANGQWTETVLETFAGGSDGERPAAGLIFDAAGNLYGTTRFGGKFGLACQDVCGTVFKLSPVSGGGWSKSTLYEFTAKHGDGKGPATRLIFDEAGNLYGTTLYGGGGFGCTCGTVFKLSPQPGVWKETLLQVFAGSDASYPIGSLLFDQAGNLYGTAENGAIGNSGSVFQLTPVPHGNWDENLLYVFSGTVYGSTDGAYPAAGLIFGTDGTLYGTTQSGGRGYGGTVFKITP